MTTRIRLCGRLEIELGGVRIEGRLPGRQGPLVVAVLALNRDRPVSRDELIGILWPDRPPADPQEALSAVLSKVRQVVGREVLSGRRELMLVLSEDAEIDLAQALTAAERARVALGAGDAAGAWEAAATMVEIAGRGLLPGHDAPWLDDRRTELEDARLRALETRAEAGLALGGASVDGAERSAADLVRAAPLREAGHRLLMQALAARGEIAEALEAYERLRVLLRDELGATPGAAARALHEQLLTGDAPALAATPPSRPRALGPDRVPERLAQTLASRWVGRHAALRRLRERAELAAAGRTALAFVTGDGGIGKTRLVAELAHRLECFEVLYGRCDEEELFPFGPWIDMLRPRLARMPEPELAELVRGAPELARLLPELHERLPRLPALPPIGDPETQRRQMFGAVVAVVRQLAAEGPVLMVVDDLHWADRSSLLLARHIAQEPTLGKVLTIGTFRDSELQPGHPLPGLLAELERGRGELLRLSLDGMDEREVSELVGGDVPPGSVTAIHSETGGNPFFAKQLARHLAESGERPRRARMRDVIALSVARLSERRRPECFGIAALIGRDSTSTCSSASPTCPTTTCSTCSTAPCAARCWSKSPSAPGRFSFAHALLRTTLEGELARPAGARLRLPVGRDDRTAPRRPAGALARAAGAATSQPPGQQPLTVGSSTPGARPNRRNRAARLRGAAPLLTDAPPRRSGNPSPYADQEKRAQLNLASARRGPLETRPTGKTHTSKPPSGPPAPAREAGASGYLRPAPRSGTPTAPFVLESSDTETSR